MYQSVISLQNPQGVVHICGQLGHGDTAAYKAPKRVDSLLGRPVHHVACGEDFTLCVSGKYFMCVWRVGGRRVWGWGGGGGGGQGEGGGFFEWVEWGIVALVKHN